MRSPLESPLHRLAAFALASAVTSSAFGYVLLSPARRWFDTPVTITVDSNGISSINDADNGVQAAVGAVNAWNGPCCVDPVAGVAGTVDYVQGDGKPDVIFSDPLNLCTGNCIAATLTGYYDISQSEVCDGLTVNEIYDADVSFNLGFDYTAVDETGGCSNEIFLEAVLTHEVGHVIGIGHSANTQAVMYPSVAYCDNKLLFSDDVNARDALYDCTSSSPPDLLVSALSAPALGGAGLSINIADTTANNGAGSADASSTQFYLSTNTTLDGGDPLLGSRPVPILASGASSPGNTTVTIPGGTAPGTYRIIAKADGGEVIPESNENNNLRNVSIKIGPDLLISSLGAPASSGAGKTISITDTNKNQGGGNAGASNTRLYLSTNNTYEAGDTALGVRGVPLIAPAGTNSGSTSVTIPGGTATGSYFLLARADADGVVAETLETNNLKSKAIKIGPDLTVSNVTAPASAGQGTPITIKDTVKNGGGGDAGPSQTGLYLSVNQALDGGDVLLGTRNVPLVAAGLTNAGSTVVIIPAMTAPGNYYLIVKTDNLGVVVELNETNNIKTKAITIF